ncbi:helix-turn-helix domain-containing protein [Pseudomonas aeruginosa]
MKGAETEGLAPRRASVSLQIGELVSHKGENYRLSGNMDYHHMVGIHVVTRISKALPIAELKRVTSEEARADSISYSLDHVADQDWVEAERRWAIILPLIKGDLYKAGAVEARAQEFNVSRATIYRWIERYKSTGEYLALIPKSRGWKEGSSRLCDKVELIISNVIQSFYLTTRRPSKLEVHRVISDACKLQGLPSPSLPAVSRRIEQVPPKVRLKARGYGDVARDTYEPTPSRYEADYPLHRIQIDHTPADVIIVDDVFRRAIGRPFLTLSIDMYTRLINGYYLSLYEPSALSVAMCLVQAMLPKHKWLNHHGIDGEWNAWGKPYEVHSDNGPDFKAKSLIQSCTVHKIEREFRPVKTPHWGGHIESLMNTKAKAFATLPGATWRNINERGEVNSDGKAALTFAEFERWLIAEIIKYNNKPHSGIAFMSPASKWHEAFFGSSLRRPICGLPPVPECPITLEIDFLPSAYKTVQTYGVEWNACYYAEVLRPWIGRKDPSTNKTQKMVFRRDPRDINYIWFFEPVEGKYHKIPILDDPYPGVTVAEYRKAKLQVKKEGLNMADSGVVRKMIALQKSIVEEASAKKKSLRREGQKTKNNAKSRTPAVVFTGDAVPASNPVNVTPKVIGDEWGDDGEVTLYGGVE